uniref:Uncharacterized protein n=1 Tax=Arion vulgaris TaxID=1028688 RepID=A0A0B7B2G9_9EUPU
MRGFSVQHNDRAAKVGLTIFILCHQIAFSGHILCQQIAFSGHILCHHITFWSHSLVTKLPSLVTFPVNRLPSLIMLSYYILGKCSTQEDHHILSHCTFAKGCPSS